MIFNIAESFIFIPKFGIYHVNRLGSGASIGWAKVSRNTNILYLIDAIIDFSRNYLNNKKLASHIIIYFLKLRRVTKTLTSNEYNIKLITSCIKRILNSPYINSIHKSEIKMIVKKMEFIKVLYNFEIKNKDIKNITFIALNLTFLRLTNSLRIYS